MKRLFALMVLMTCFVHAEEPGSQFLKAAESGDRRAQYFLADTWFSSGDLSKAEYWAQKAADNGDAFSLNIRKLLQVLNHADNGEDAAALNVYALFQSVNRRQQRC